SRRASSCGLETREGCPFDFASFDFAQEGPGQALAHLRSSRRASSCGSETGRAVPSTSLPSTSLGRDQGQALAHLRSSRRATSYTRISRISSIGIIQGKSDK
ncbi:MAG: hypothetical protein KAT35_03665, partial [Candidatus Aenigmarchaeota archaeon]|nr:hypothetical protein [Candidatus Aenigmarchaeota archaeon]